MERQITPKSKVGALAFSEHVALPNAGLFTFVIMWGEVLVEIALVLGLVTNFAALMCITMNFAFLFSNTVSTNGIMIMGTFFILAAGFNAGRYDLDKWVIPYLRQYTRTSKTKTEKHIKGKQTTAA